VLFVERNVEKEKPMIGWIKRQWREHAEWRWAIAALGLWFLVGVALEPATGTISLDFVHKITAGIFRASVAVWLTFLEMRLVFPTIHEWIKAGEFRNTFRGTGSNLSRVYVTAFIAATFFVGNVIALSL